MKLPATLLSVVTLVSCSGGPAPEQKANTITLKGRTEDGLSKSALPGTEVCVLDHDDIPCVNSDPLGNWTLPNVPQSSELVLSFFTSGYMQSLAMFTTTDADDEFTFGLLSDTAMDLMAGTAGVEVDGARGQIIFGTNDRKGGDRVAGVSVALSPANGEGPFYQGSNGIDRMLTATGEKGTGGIFNVDPGDYEITFTSSSLTCSPNFAWKTDRAGTVKVRSKAAHTTYVSQICN